MSKYHTARRRFAEADGAGLLEAFGATELLPLMQAGTLRLIGGDPDEEWGELEFVVEGLGDENPLDGTQYLLKIHRDEDVESERGVEFGAGEGPNQKYNIETDTCADGCPSGGEHVEGFDDADGAIAWIESELASPRDEWRMDHDEADECPTCGSEDIERTPEGLIACPDCNYIGRERL